MSPDDDGRSPIRFSLLELVCFVAMVTAVQGTVTVLLEHASSGQERPSLPPPLSYLPADEDATLARTPAVQVPVLFLSVTVALLGSAWGSWTAKRLRVTTSLKRAGFMALGTLWVAMLPVAVTMLFALPFLFSGWGVQAPLVFLFSWAVVIGANTIPVKMHRKALAEDLARREAERLGDLPVRQAPGPPAPPAPPPPPRGPGRQGGAGPEDGPPSAGGGPAAG